MSTVGATVEILVSPGADSGSPTAHPPECRVPVVGHTPVAEIVRTCHERMVDDGLASLAIPGLDRSTLEPVLTYCAEMACAADGATCPGCRRRAESRGVANLDAFIAQHAEIVVAQGAVRLTGPGDRRLTVASLDDLAKSWAGEEYWFWARRVLRKLRFGIRRSQISGQPAVSESDTPVVILMEPQLPDNIGMVARAMGNFALDTLRLVDPRDGWPNEKARIAASGANYVIDRAAAHDDITSALSDLTYVVATTARQRDMRKPVLTPEQAVAEMRHRIAAGERCGILFGRERNGLETSEVSRCDAIVMIPVNSSFASLNLAQAVLILGYEWMRTSPVASLGRVTTYERPKSLGVNLGQDRRATKNEVAGLMGHLTSELTRLGFLAPPRDKGDVMQGVETMIVRAEPTEQEVRTLRGIVATLAHGKGKARKSST
ncbi:MAG: RNA methyltransferase [Hyphomicrobium aestuarii]|nr:RNA methyltransferase [Hyphomicrobium aestuarii]